LQVQARFTSREIVGVLLNDFQPRGTRLEYWYVKLQSGELSLLVDWIVRRHSARGGADQPLGPRPGQGRADDDRAMGRVCRGD